MTEEKSKPATTAEKQKGTKKRGGAKRLEGPRATTELYRDGQRASICVGPTTGGFAVRTRVPGQPLVEESFHSFDDAGLRVASIIEKAKGSGWEEKKAPKAEDLFALGKKDDAPAS